MSNKEEIDALKKRVDVLENWVKEWQQHALAACAHEYELRDGVAVCKQCGHKREI
jgi:hypothetical protein